MASADLTAALTGIVGENGELYLSGMPEEGRLSLKWGQITRDLPG
jgi:outer membrane usher protein